jgi:hypothetical protein
MPSADPDRMNFQPFLAAFIGIKKGLEGQDVILEAGTACARRLGRLFK